MPQEKHPVRGILAGIAGGLVAAWAMNVFSETAGPKINQAVEPEDYLKQQAEAAKEPHADATMKTADAIVETVTGGRHLTWEQQEKGGPIVHYAFGAIMGGLYGGLAEYVPAASTGLGTAFGSVLFGTADLAAVPALHLSGAVGDYPASSLLTPFTAHLVYGVTTELVRRTVRLVL